MINDDGMTSETVVIAARVEDASSDEPFLRLAAARAALDPERQAWRHDILVSAVVSALGLYGSLTTERLQANVSRSWATGTVSRLMLGRALEVANEAGLVVSNRNMLSDRDEWSLSGDTMLEANQDRDWVSRTFEDFGERLIEATNEISEREISRDRGPQLAQHMFAALVRGASGTFAFAESALAVGEFRPADLDTRAAVRHLKETVQPPEVASAMQEALTRVLNPDDTLGNEVLRLLIVGNILQGLLSGRDTAEPLRDVRRRFVLDTSALMVLVDESSERELLIEFLERCRKLNADIVVAEHTLAEYERVWQSAENEVQHLDTTEVRRASDGYVLVRNPVLRAYAKHLQQGPISNWTRFSLGRRNIRQFLESHGILVRHHGNESPEDVRIVELVTARLLELSDDKTRLGTRSPSAAADDANTAAMVGRWRRADPTHPPIAWMVGSDRKTGEAYARHAPDGYQLCLPTSAALLLLSYICGDNSETVVGLADTLSSVLTRDSFLAVAASYTFDEVLELAEKLAPGSALSVQDAAVAVQLNFETFLEESSKTLSEADKRVRATRVVQRRGLRQSARSRRSVDNAELEKQRLEKQVVAARAEGLVEGQRSREEEVAEERRRRREAEDRAGRFVRGAVLLAVATIGAAAIVMFAVNEALSTRGWMAATAVLLIAVALGIRSIVLGTRNVIFVVELVVTIGSIVMGLLLDWGFQ